MAGAPGSSHEVLSHGGGLGTAPLHADPSLAPTLANRRGAGGALPPGGGRGSADDDGVDGGGGGR
eukprot:7543895-Alexandrium_andersonii.AAC.1